MSTSFQMNAPIEVCSSSCGCGYDLISSTPHTALRYDYNIDA